MPELNTAGVVLTNNLHILILLQFLPDSYHMVQQTVLEPIKILVLKILHHNLSDCCSMPLETNSYFDLGYDPL